MAQEKLSSVMNDTKCQEIRQAMYAYHHPVRWRTKDVETGNIIFSRSPETPQILSNLLTQWAHEHCRIA